MTMMVRTWWGEKFLRVLERCMDSGRLRRGRSYSGPGRLLEFEIDGHTARAKVRGNVNPYFGVYREPRYQVSVSLKQFTSTDWDRIAGQISHHAAILSQLLMNEMPTNIEGFFASRRLQLLPEKGSDLISRCSCPDYASPCKHVAGVYYKIASLLDRDPLLLFQLRGMQFARLREKLATSPLGQALLDQLGEDTMEMQYDAHRYSAPTCIPMDKTDLKSFWHGAPPLPEVNVIPEGPVTPAILVKKGGDFPGFWHHGNSFIEMMEPIYLRIVNRNRQSL